MAMLHSFTAGDFLDSFISLVVAFVLGTLIGAERQYRQRSGGLRTNVLVAVGAAAFVDIGQHINGNPGAVQVIAYVVSGVGFLGAGVIMKEGGNVWGLNTAATLWCSAAVGACAGADLAAEAVMLTAFVLAGNTLLRPLVNAINRVPITEGGTEAIYEVRLIVADDRVDEGRELMETLLSEASYPFREIETTGRDDGTSELTATLVGTEADPRELDEVVAQLNGAPVTRRAGWSLRTGE
jgi:putative Mg2+ transporter-C (MgtC) family protein